LNLGSIVLERKHPQRLQGLRLYCGMMRQDKPHIEFQVIGSPSESAQGAGKGASHVAQSAHLYKRFGFRSKK
jgi:hypothetical protein